MQALTFLALVNAACLSILAQLVPNNGQYVLPPELMDSGGYVVKIMPKAPVSYANPFPLYQNPYAPMTYVNTQDNFAPGVYDEYKKRERLKLFYDSLAAKLSSALLDKIAISNQANGDNIQGLLPMREVLTSKSALSKESAPILDTGRRSPSFNTEESDTPIIIPENSLDSLDDNTRKYLNRITYIINKIPQTSIAEQAGGYSSLNGQQLYGMPLVQNIGITGPSVPYISGNNLNGGLGVIPQPTASKSYSYSLLQPFPVLNPVINNITPANNIINIDTRNEPKDIVNFLLRLMLAENHISPGIVQFLNDVENINDLKLEELDETQLAKLSVNDTNFLKKYLTLVINAYGLTPYTFKLLEYIYLVEGKPKNEMYLLLKILNDDQAIQNYNEDEWKLLQGHLLQIYKDYGESPYVLAFLRSIAESPSRPTETDRLVIFEDLDNFGMTNDEQEENIRKIYSYLSQVYNDNISVLKILKNIKAIHENTAIDIVMPDIELNDLKSLTDVSHKDLNILVNFILQVISLRGDNAYLTTILSYINQLQNSNGALSSNDDKVNNESAESMNLSQINKYLSGLNIKDISNQDLLAIINGLLENQNNNLTVIGLNDTKNTFGDDNFVKLKDILLNLKQVIPKTELKIVSQPVILNEGHNVVEMSPHDLELINEYILDKQTAIPYEMLQLIKEAQSQVDENGVINLKYNDLMQIYNYLLQTQGNDMNDKVFVKDQQYLNQKDTSLNEQNDLGSIDVNTKESSNIDIEKEIDLEKLNKFLLHNSIPLKSDPALFDTLKDLNENLTLPYGQHELKIKTLNNTKPREPLSQNDLEKVPFFQNIQGNNDLYAELLDNLTNETLVKEPTHADDPNPLPIVKKDPLNRIKNYLQTLIAKDGKNPDLLQIIFEINKILGSPQTDSNPHVLSDTNSYVNDGDLKTIIQYLTTKVNVSDTDSDLTKLLEYIHDSQVNVQKQDDNRTKEESGRLYFIDLINNEDVSPAIKDILKVLMVDKIYENPDLVVQELNNSKKLENLNTNDLNVLMEYLRPVYNQLQTKSGVQQLLDNVLKQKEDAVTEKNVITIDTQIYTPGNNKTNVTILGDDIKDTHLIDLLDPYGKDGKVLRILYDIDHIKADPDIKRNLTKLITKSNKNGTEVNTDDLSSIAKYILRLLHDRRINQKVMKLVRDIISLYREPVKDVKVSIAQVNNTHIAAIIDQEDLKRIQTYLNNMTNRYDLSPYLTKILKIISRNDNISAINNNKNQNIYTFTRLKPDELSQLTKYLLELIEKHGTLPELINTFQFVNEIYADNIEANTPDDKIKEQHVFEVSKEMDSLLQQGVMQTIRQMSTASLNNLYMQLLETIFISPDNADNAESTQVTEKLLNIYKSEVTPTRKYILLKIYDYLSRNKSQFETLWQPSFVLVLLDLKKEASTENTDVLNNDDGNYIVVEPYNYTKDIDLALTKLVQNMFKAQQENNDAIVNNEDILAKYTINQVSDTTHEETKSSLKDVSCQDANKKFDAILKLLENIFNLNENDNKIDLNMQDFIKVFEIINMFRNRLSVERRGEVTPSSALIFELERQLLQQNEGTCHQQPNAIAQTLISRLVDVLQEVIQYLKANDYDDETIREIVVNLVEIVMPDINAIALKDCEARAQRELIGKLFSKIYSGKNVERNKIQFVSGYKLKRDSVDNIFHLLSMQQLLDDISKYKNL